MSSDLENLEQAAPQTPLTLYRARKASGEIRPDPAQEFAVQKLQSVSMALRGYEPSQASGGLFARLGFGRKTETNAPQGLYIFGDVGRGKSMLMDLFFETAPVERKRRVHFHAFMQEIHGRLHALRQKNKGTVSREVARPISRSGEDQAIPKVAADIAEDAWLLCFDEFHVTNITDAMILGRLFEQLFENGCVVVATSNFAPDDLYKGGLQRDRFLPFIEILKDHLDVLQLSSEQDYRMTGLKGHPVYHAPLGDVAEAEMAKAFRRLALGEPGGSEEIIVQGRTVPVPKAAGTVAWFGFADLCEQPLGPADYLAIADRYPTVLVSGIPRLTPDMRNEARRLITLIDAFYEKKVKLICSAAAPAHALYPQGEGAFEFTRTVSRLVEMQSAAYLDA